LWEPLTLRQVRELRELRVSSRGNHALGQSDSRHSTTHDDRLETQNVAAQIKLLKLLALLGAGDQAASENMYQVVAMTMREGAKHGNTIGNALVYEAVRTVTAIYPNPTLLQQGESVSLARYLAGEAARPSMRQTPCSSACPAALCRRIRCTGCSRPAGLTLLPRCCSGGDDRGLPACGQPQPQIRGHRRSRPGHPHQRQVRWFAHFAAAIYLCLLRVHSEGMHVSLIAHCTSRHRTSRNGHMHAPYIGPACIRKREICFS